MKKQLFPQKKVWIIWLAMVLLVWAQPGWTSAQVPVPKSTGFVTDLSGKLSENEEKDLNRKLADLEKRRGSQIVVLLLDGTSGEPIESFAQRLFNEWKPGRKGVDDGVLVVISVMERKARIHTGYGLEAAIPDVLAKRILERIGVPAFKSGGYYEGLSGMLDVLIAAVEKEPLPLTLRMSSPPNSFIFWTFVVLTLLKFGAASYFIFHRDGDMRPGGYVILGIVVLIWIPFVFYALDLLPLKGWLENTLGIAGGLLTLADLYLLYLAVKLAYAGILHLIIKIFKIESYGGSSNSSRQNKPRSLNRTEQVDPPDSTSSSTESKSEYKGGGGRSGGGGASSSW